MRFIVCFIFLICLDAHAEVRRRTLLRPYLHVNQGPIPIAWFDADMTIRITRSGNHFPVNSSDVVILPMVPSVSRQLAAEGYFNAIASNQGRISAGQATIEEVDLTFQHTVAEIEKAGGIIHWYDFAEAVDENRKPGIGMLERVAKFVEQRFGPVSKELSFLSGDAAYKKGEMDSNGREGSDFENFDRLAAERFGIQFKDPRDVFLWEQMFRVARFRSLADVERLNGFSCFRSKASLP